MTFLTIKKLAVLGSLVIAQQSFAQDAKTTFTQALQAYENGDYSNSIAKANEAESQLGKTNSRIQSLKALAYNEQGNLNRSLLELELYFKTAPDRSSSEYTSMEALYTEMKSTARSRYDADLKEIENQRKVELQKIQESVNAGRDQYFFGVAKQAGTVEAYDLFLKKNTSSSLKAEAEKLLAEQKNVLHYNQLVIEGLELIKARSPRQAVDKFSLALEIKSDPWLSARMEEAKLYSADLAYNAGIADLLQWKFESARQNFIYVQGISNTEQVRLKLQEATDELTFEKATERADPLAMKAYLSAYPQGRKKGPAEGFLLNYHLKQATENVARHNPEASRTSLAEIANLRGSKHWDIFSADYYALVLQEAEYLTSGPKKQRIVNILPAIDYYEQLNEGSGKNYSGKVRQLKAKNKEWSRPNMGFVALLTDQTISDVGVMLGSNNNRGLGMNLSLKAPPQIFSSGSFDPKGQDYLKGTLGLNFSKKIIYPFWIYAGAGYTNFQSVDAIASEPGKGQLGDETIDTVSLEGGFALHFKPVFLTINSSIPYLSGKQRTQMGMLTTPTYINFGLGLGW